MALTHTDVRRILDILDHAGHLEALEVSLGEFVLRARKRAASVGFACEEPAHHPDSAAAVPAIALESGQSGAPPGASKAVVGGAVRDTMQQEMRAGTIPVRAPLLGTFYRRAKPEEPPFVEVGSRVEAGTPIALLETMKLFNTLAAPQAGRIAAILAEDATVVERDALLMIIEAEPQP